MPWSKKGSASRKQEIESSCCAAASLSAAVNVVRRGVVPEQKSSHVLSSVTVYIFFDEVKIAFLFQDMQRAEAPANIKGE